MIPTTDDISESPYGLPAMIAFEGSDIGKWLPRTIQAAWIVVGIQMHQTCDLSR